MCVCVCEYVYTHVNICIHSRHVARVNSENNITKLFLFYSQKDSVKPSKLLLCCAWWSPLCSCARLSLLCLENGLINASFLLHLAVSSFRKSYVVVSNYYVLWSWSCIMIMHSTFCKLRGVFLILLNGPKAVS